MNTESVDRLGKRAFSNAYQCMQLVNICVLYETFDFNEQKVKDITFEFAKLDKEDNETGIADAWAIAIKKEYGFDCYMFPLRMPYRQRLSLAVIPKGVHDNIRRNFLVESVDRAVFSYFSIMMWVLKEFCLFKKEDFEKYLDGFAEICKLFPKGMSLKWMIEFVENEIGWEFEKCADSTECCKKMEEKKNGTGS